MALHGKRYSTTRSRRTSKRVSDATLGTHVNRTPSASQARSRQSTQRSARIASRASQNHLDTLMPSATSGEDQAAYRKRSQQRRYVESLQRRAAAKRIAAFVIAALVVVGVAAGAGMLAFRGVIGSQMALRDSNAAEALGAVKEGEPTYTLVAVELGAAATPLEQEGPDMVLLVREDRQAGKLKIISIPSALKVTVDNDAKRLGDLAAEGDAALIAAVESYGKIDVNHFIKLDEGGLAGIVDALGDLEVTFNQVIDDPRAGDVYYPAGTYRVNGPGALTYLRATNIKMGKNDQMANQAEFAKLIVMRLVNSPSGFASDIEAIDEFFQTDLSLSNLEDFAKWVAGIGEAGVACAVAPGYFTVSSDVVGDSGELYVSKAADFAELIGSADGDEGAEGVGGGEEASVQSVADPTTFTVEVVNGTDIVGAAKTTAEALSAAGFRIADVGNAEQQVYDETLVIYRTRNTPAPAPEPVVDEEGNVIDGGAAAGDVGAYASEGEGEVEGQTAKSRKAAEEERAKADAAERELGASRANAVIQQLGIGRVVEGDMYYAFSADVLLIIGYDYKPVV